MAHRSRTPEQMTNARRAYENLPIKQVERERDHLRDLLVETLPYLTEGGYTAELADRILDAVKES